MNGVLESVRPVVEIRDLTKRFQGAEALSDVSLAIPQGSIVGLLGANGAGKTTLLRHMIGHALPDAGSCLTLGCRAAALTAAELARIGVVHQEEQLVEWMSVRQCIAYVRAHYPTWNDALADKLATDFELETGKRIAALSTGQRQRLMILLAVAFEPELLLLDEPAAALDPIARADFLDMLLDMIQSRTRTIVISSHILSDVEKIIDRTVILDHGRVVCDRPFADLQEAFCRVRLQRIGDPLPADSPFAGALAWKGDANSASGMIATPTDEQVSNVETDLECRIERSALSLDELYRCVLNRSEGTDDEQAA
jgi:ABC-2 type transport system ATP-binding protein